MKINRRCDIAIRRSRKRIDAEEIVTLNQLLLRALAHVRDCVTICRAGIKLSAQGSGKLAGIYARLLKMYMKSSIIIEKLKPTMKMKKVSSILLNLTKSYNTIKKDFLDKYENMILKDLRTATGKALGVFVKATMVANALAEGRTRIGSSQPSAPSGMGYGGYGGYR